MKYEEFIQKVIESKVRLYKKYEDFIQNIDERLEYMPSSRVYSVPWEEVFICKQWVSGGASGGNCWGDEATEIETDEEPFFDDFEILFECIFPLISQRTRHETCCCLLSDITIKDVGYTESEYYGNYTVYDMRAISLFHIYKIFEKLRKKAAHPPHFNEGSSRIIFS